MRLKEFQKKWEAACDRLIAKGHKKPRGELETSNTPEDKRVTMSAIFMPPRSNKRDLEKRKKYWREWRKKKNEENNNDSE